MASVGVALEERFEHRGGAVEVVDPFEERGDTDAAAGRALGDVVEAGLAGEQDWGEDVGWAFAHRDDAGAGGVGPADALDPPCGAEAAQGVIVVRGQRHAGGVVIAVEFAGKEGFALFGVEIEVAAAGRQHVEGAQDGVGRLVEVGGVIADIERGEVEAECAGAVDQRLHHGVGGGGRAVRT